ncbi:hypothetical protein GCM10009119_37310 [Algoriphagus jejuensis]|uniref:Uncharacterized protein n=1 Tax=Algoriphagus jejuensis TaxID=419934 RepID=A0ABN1N4G3_9BACT
MKKLPEHTPKASTWEDLLKKADFESQLNNHLPSLPNFAPQDGAWEKITAELDRKKFIPIWVRWSAAAAVAGIFLAFLISLNRSVDPMQDQELLTDNPIEIDNSAVEVLPSDLPIVADAFAENTENAPFQISPKKKVKRTTETIEAPKMGLPEIDLSLSKNLSLEIPEKQIQESTPPKTLHQVSISWSKIKPGLQVKTSFGRMGSELGEKQQASTHHLGQLTVEIDN